MLVLALMTLTALPVSAQFGTWDKLKSKAKAAWNSEERKELWDKTKQMTKDGVQKVRESDVWDKTKSKVKQGVDKLRDTELLRDYNYTVPYTGRRFLNVIPDDYLNKQAASEYTSFLRKSSRSANSQQVAQVSRVSKRLIQSVEELYAFLDREDELDDVHWEINLVHNDAANAMCYPGGKIVVYDGILEVANDDASLAAVIGHEIAHALAKHSAEHLTDRAISAVGMAAITGIVATSSMSTIKKEISVLLAGAGITWVNLKFSRKDEDEADRIGVLLAAMAGYDTDKAIAFWQRMESKSGNHSTHDWYSTHPSPANRVANMRKHVREAKEYARNF